jgi:hypothetical protein
MCCGRQRVLSLTKRIHGSIRRISSGSYKSPSSNSALPTPCFTGLTEAERKALVIADNRLSDLGRFDTDLLLMELGELSEDGFDLGSIGYDPSDMDALFHGAGLEPEPAKAKKRKVEGAKKLANHVQRALTAAQDGAAAAYVEFEAKADAKDASEAAFLSGKASFGSEVLSWISKYLGAVPDADDVVSDL